MKKSVIKNSVIAALVAAGTIVPTTAAMAQQKPVIAAPRSVLPAGVKKTSQPIRYQIPKRYSWLNNWRSLRVATPRIGTAWRSTNIPRRPTTTSNNTSSARPVVMTPTRGPIGTPIRLQVNRNFGATPALLSFKAYVSRGVPARVHTRLSGGGNSYTVPAPIQLCIQGGGTWQAELVLSNGRNLGVVGSFTPTNCPR